MTAAFRGQRWRVASISGNNPACREQPGWDVCAELGSAVAAARRDTYLAENSSIIVNANEWIQIFWEPSLRLLCTRAIEVDSATVFVDRSLTLPPFDLRCASANQDMTPSPEIATENRFCL